MHLNKIIINFPFNSDFTWFNQGHPRSSCEFTTDSREIIMVLLMLTQNALCQWCIDLEERNIQACFLCSMHVFKQMIFVFKNRLSRLRQEQS